MIKESMFSLGAEELIFFNQLIEELKASGFEDLNPLRKPSITPVAHLINPAMPKWVADDYLRIGFREGSIIAAIVLGSKRIKTDTEKRIKTLEHYHGFLHMGEGGMYYQIIDIEQSDPLTISHKLHIAFNEPPKSTFERS